MSTKGITIRAAIASYYTAMPRTLDTPVRKVFPNAGFNGLHSVEHKELLFGVLLFKVKFVTGPIIMEGHSGPGHSVRPIPVLVGTVPVHQSQTPGDGAPLVIGGLLQGIDGKLIAGSPGIGREL